MEQLIKSIQWMVDHPEFMAVVVTAIYEVVARRVPTKRSYSVMTFISSLCKVLSNVFALIHSLLNALLKDRKNGTGAHDMWNE
jgi:Mg2+/Co2+ transporter CorB